LCLFLTPFHDGLFFPLLFLAYSFCKHTQEDKGMYEYKKFRKSVLQRDKRCVLCKKSNELIVHHLNGYHWFEEGRYDVENGITLCQECHIKFHRKFGNRDNTKEQFYEWSNNEIEL
jgi:5-methylcytosine-specific restriction endonuclease McrA